jgi:hypothetical protein
MRGIRFVLVLESVQNLLNTSVIDFDGDEAAIARLLRSAADSLERTIAKTSGSDVPER